ncbi:MAG: recombinase family protein [Bacillota bacterium]|nr:recombinase family protein [Bacillota bacterium]
MKVAIYSRKSKFKEEGESIENQINMCIDYAKTRLGIDSYEIFEDEGFSGKDTKRPNFQKLLKDIKDKKYTHFMCYRLDRAFRNVADYSSHLELFKKYGVEFISIKEQFDTTTAMGRAMMNVSATFAQLERETTAERIKDNLRELSKTGRWLGGPAPLGYRSIEVENTDGKGKNRKKHILEQYSEEIDIVKIVFNLFMEYKSFQKVSRILENNGMFSRTGQVFSRQLVKQLINNPTYVIADDIIIKYFKDIGAETYISNEFNGKNGLMGYNRRKENGTFSDIKDWIVSIGEHEGVISSDVWIKSQNISKEINSNSKANRRGTGQEDILSGLVVCDKCSSGMAPRQQSNKLTNGEVVKYRYYTCNLKSRNSSRCDNTGLDAFEAEEYVVNELLNTENEKIISNLEENNKNKFAKLSNEQLIKNHKDAIQENEKTISKLLKKFAFVDEDEELMTLIKDEIKALKNTNSNILAEIKALELKNDQLTFSNESVDDIISRFDNFKKFYKFAETLEDKKRLIQSVVKFITWNCDTRIIDIILVGSSRERPSYNLHLGNRNRSNIDLNVNTLSLKLKKRTRR